MGRGSRIFRYRKAILISGTLAGVIGCWWAFAFLWWVTPQYVVWPGLFFLVVGIALTIMWGILLIVTSDIIVSDEGVSRSIAGLTLQFYRWSQIAEAKAWIFHGVSVKRDRYFYALMPQSSEQFFGRLKYMVFDESVMNADELVRILNFHLLRNRIPVSRKIDGSLPAVLSGDVEQYQLPSPLIQAPRT